MTAIQNGRKSPTNQSLAAAQSRFTQAVSQGIVQLMQQCGYSRERATAALLRELGRDTSPNKDDEVFHTMTTFGLGVDDASHALTVSRAVKRAMKERGLSAVEAIDDLSSKLCISNLVAYEEPEEQPLVTSRPSSPQQHLQQRTTAPTTTLSTTDRVSTCQQRKRKANVKSNHKNVKQKKNQSRKRPAPDDSKKFSSRERADSVTVAVEQKAKKARRSPEDAASPETEPIIVRSKRANATTAHQDSQSSTV